VKLNLPFNISPHVFVFILSFAFSLILGLCLYDADAFEVRSDGKG